MEYKKQTFDLPKLEGLSEEQIKVHLGLYEGYVKHVNLIREQIMELKKEGAPAYVLDELRRRYSFEWNGIRMHEYYFEQLEGGPNPLDQDMKLAKKILEKFPDIEYFINHIKEVAGTRGIGWVVGTYDEREGVIHVLWVEDHELGQLAGAKMLFAIDMWEHAFMVDYTPAEKGAYIDVFLENLNWSVVEKRFATTN